MARTITITTERIRRVLVRTSQAIARDIPRNSEEPVEPQEKKKEKRT